MKYLSTLKKLLFLKRNQGPSLFKQITKIPGSAKEQEKKQTRRKKDEVKNGGATKKERLGRSMRGGNSFVVLKCRTQRRM